MNFSPDEPEIRVSTGILRGVRENGLLVFRGVPYARAERFAPPEPVAAWTGVREAVKPGPICPQPPARPDGVMGQPRDDLVQDEDCLNLTVLTPAADDSRRPVLVWIHGGAYVTGASSFGFYDGRRLVADGDVVFVSINYRLGALGYLKLPGVSPGNLGLADQLAALRWVQENIAAFGGDPARVTVFGQSAGAHSIACLMATAGARGLFSRAILQSAPLGLRPSSPARAARIARHFTRALAADPRRATVADILAAQAATIARVSGPGGLVSPPFCPVARTPLVPPAEKWLPSAACANVDVMIGTTSAEMDGFLNGKPVTTRIEHIPWVGRPGMAAAKTLATQLVFARPSLRFADLLAAGGRTVFTYRFGWAAPKSIFGACHCIELPFLLGDQDAWAAAPMLAGASWDTIEEIGRPLRQAWLSFARTGSPGSWPAHTPGAGPGREWSGPPPATVPQVEVS